MIEYLIKKYEKSKKIYVYYESQPFYKDINIADMWFRIMMKYRDSILQYNENMRLIEKNNERINNMQELKQIKLVDAIGKKIIGVKISCDKHIIKYDDGTFTFFERYEDWGSPSQCDVILKYEKFIEKLGIRPDGSTYFTNTQKMLIDLEILDGDKLIADAKERIEKYVIENNMREIKQYEKLKQKFHKYNDFIVKYVIDGDLNNVLEYECWDENEDRVKYNFYITHNPINHDILSITKK